jgi:DNA helicase IV
MGVQLTDEQNTVLSHIRDNFVTIVNALAGTGKTTVIEKYMADNPRTLYLCFNKVLADKMSHKFAARTFHSIAFEQVDKKYGPIKVNETSSSTDFEAMIEGTKEWTHAGYLELFASKTSFINKAFIEYDTIIVDEAQDLTLTMCQILEVLRNRKKTIAIFGDTFQRIYDFQNSICGITYMSEKYKIQPLYLTKSFRLPIIVSNLANRILKELNPSAPRIKPKQEVGHILSQSNSASVAVIGRSHDSLADWIKRNQPDMELVYYPSYDNSSHELCEDFDLKSEKGKKIHLHTVHSAKGLEFGQVIILNDFEATDEETMRLFYTAVTRSSRSIVTSHPLALDVHKTLHTKMENYLTMLVGSN